MAVLKQQLDCGFMMTSVMETRSFTTMLTMLNDKGCWHAGATLPSVAGMV